MPTMSAASTPSRNATINAWSPDPPYCNSVATYHLITEYLSRNGGVNAGDNRQTGSVAQQIAAVQRYLKAVRRPDGSALILALLRASRPRSRRPDWRAK